MRRSAGTAAGKSTLLRILSGEQAPDAGSVWRQPGVRASRGSSRTCPSSTDRPVFDVVADGLGDLSELVAGLSPRGRRRWPSDATPARARDARPAAARARGARRLAHRAARRAGARRGSNLPAGRRSSTRCRAAGAAACCSRARWWPSPTCCCSTSRPTTSTSTPSRGSRTFLADYAGRRRVRHARSRVPPAPRDAHRRARSRAADVVARRLRDVPAQEGGVARQRGGAAGEVRQAAGRGGGVAAPGHQGAADAQRRPRARADGDARASARRAASSRARCGCRSSAPSASGQLVFEADGVSQGVRRRRRSCATSRRASCAAIASASSGRTAPARRRCCGCCSASWRPTRARSGAAPTCRSPTTTSSASSSIPSGPCSTRSATATTR